MSKRHVRIKKDFCGLTRARAYAIKKYRQVRDASHRGRFWHFVVIP